MPLPFGLPLVLLLHMQGFGRVRVNAALTSIAAVLEVLGSAASLRWQQQQQPAGSTNSINSSDGGASSLVALGCVAAVCQGLLAAASLACIVALPPVEARGRVSLVRQVFGLSGGSSTGGSSGSDGAWPPTDSEEPLLAGAASNREQQLQREGEGEQQQQQQQQQRQPGVSVAAPPPPPRRPLFDRATREFLRCAVRPSLPLAWAGWGRQLLQAFCRARGASLLPSAEVHTHTLLPGTPPSPAWCRDGAHMFARTTVLQLTFFLALAAAARLGTAALAGQPAQLPLSRCTALHCTALHCTALPDVPCPRPAALLQRTAS